MSDIFVSYAHGDRGFIDHLCADIAKAGVSVWYDTRIAPGSHWDTVIVDNLLHSHGLVALVSRAALRSDWVTFEWALGVRSGKEVLVLMMTRDDVSPSELPEYLRHIQALPVSDSAPNDDIIRAISAMDLPPRLWSEFSNGGVDICLPKEKFKKPDDKAVVDIEGVNLRAVNAALSLQQQLLAKVGSLSQAGDPIGIQFLPDSGTSLRSNRNYVILGGPGGVPFVHTLLMEWSGIRHDSKLESGYRFVTDPRRYFRSGPFLRPADKTGSLSRRIGPLGIEDVQHGKVAAFFGYKEASAAAGGRNYVIVYTGGLGDTTPEASKFVILAAFSRQVLDGAIRFLLSRGINNHWLAQVHHCGPYTETLLEFDVNIGQPPVLQRVHHPRTLGH